jgi:SNF2 family DNA or RNA helicase
MFIARKYRRTNVVEYVLYMWHIEEVIRSLNFDMVEIEEHVLREFELDETSRGELKRWYEELVHRMTEERLRDRGHLDELNELMTEIHYLHHSLMTLYQDREYQKLVSEAMPALDTLRQKAENRYHTDIELAMNGLFGVLVLKLRKRQVSEATQEAVKSISRMMACLAKKYNQMKAGTLSLPRVMEN